jgi:hypothetical protein
MPAVIAEDMNLDIILFEQKGNHTPGDLLHSPGYYFIFSLLFHAIFLLFEILPVTEPLLRTGTGACCRGSIVQAVATPY